MGQREGGGGAHCDGDLFAVLVKCDLAGIWDQVRDQAWLATAVAGQVDGELELFGKEAEGAEGRVLFGEFRDAPGVTEAGVAHEKVEEALFRDAGWVLGWENTVKEQKRTRLQQFGRS